MTCPECGRVLEPRQNRFGVRCWPSHNWRRITTDGDTMSRQEMQRWREDHQASTAANESDRCPMSGQPVVAF